MESRPVKKARRKQTQSKNETQVTSKKRGKLENLISMPLDVLLEIFTHLLPSDLLRLARLNKEFRRILMNRSSSSVWKAARFNAQELPDPPEDMSEPAWAHFVFDVHCHICGTTARTIDWALRKRICKKCSHENLKLLSGSDPLAPFLPARTIITGLHLCYIPQYNALLAEWELIKSKPEELKVFDKTKRSQIADILAHEKLCVAWERKCSMGKTNERNSLKQERYNAQSIAEKLQDLGWEKELEIANSAPRRLQLREHKLVNQPTRLTSRIWSNIKKPILEFMEQLRVYRVNRDRKAAAISILRDFKIKNLPYTELIPEPIDFCSLDIVKAVLERPADAVVDSNFQDVIPLLPQLFEEWRNEKLEMLQELVHKDDPDRHVNLAVSIFECACCIGSSSPPSQCLYFYPEVMIHRCLSTRTVWGRPMLCNDITIDLINYPQRRREAWSISGLHVTAKNVGAAERIVKIASLDPKMATVEDMDRLDCYFICKSCIVPDQPVSLYGWRAAVRHLLSGHSNDRHPSEIRSQLGLRPGEAYTEDVDFETVLWTTISPARVSEVATECSHMPAISADAKRWRCVHCLDLPDEYAPTTLEDVKIHLSEVHDVTSPVEDVDYFIPFPPVPASISSDHLQIEHKDFLKLTL